MYSTAPTTNNIAIIIASTRESFPPPVYSFSEAEQGAVVETF